MVGIFSLSNMMYSSKKRNLVNLIYLYFCDYTYIWNNFYCLLFIIFSSLQIWITQLSLSQSFSYCFKNLNYRVILLVVTIQFFNNHFWGIININCTYINLVSFKTHTHTLTFEITTTIKILKYQSTQKTSSSFLTIPPSHPFTSSSFSHPLIPT